MKEPNVVPATVAAEEKGCSEQSIYNALDRGDLNGTRLGSHRLVYRDAQYEAWEVQEKGRRVTKKARREK